jgi:hypothetical protein
MSRKNPTQPERVLDAQGMVDDFYRSLRLVISGRRPPYVWKARTGSVIQLVECPKGHTYLLVSISLPTLPSCGQEMIVVATLTCAVVY